MGPLGWPGYLCTQVQLTGAAVTLIFHPCLHTQLENKDVAVHWFQTAGSSLVQMHPAKTTLLQVSPAGVLEDVTFKESRGMGPETESTEEG